MARAVNFEADGRSTVPEPQDAIVEKMGVRDAFAYEVLFHGLNFGIGNITRSPGGGSG